MGHDVGISNLSNGELEWYIIGSERIAKISGSTVKGEQEDLIPPADDDPDDTNPWNGWNWQDPNPPTYGYNPDRGDHGWVYKSWGGGYQSPTIALSSQNDLELQKAISGHMSASTASVKDIFPNRFHAVHEKDNGNLIRYDRKINSALDTSVYKYQASLQIESFDQMIHYRKNNTDRGIISVNDFVGVTPIAVPAPPTSGNDGPYKPLIPGHDNPLLLVPYWYLYDHLGNTRMTLNYDCIEQEFFIPFAAYYFPYGKPIWKYELKEVDGVALEKETNGPRYLSTQHERDQGTNFDFRGARYYDSDLAMFLSVDPLAADFVDWSPYNYVLGNPIRFIDLDGKAPEEKKPTISQIVFIQFEGRASLGITTSHAVGLYIALDDFTISSVGVFTTSTLGGGLAIGGSLGLSAGVAYTTIDKFEGKGFSYGVMAPGFSGELNVYPENFKNIFSGADHKSFYETFIAGNDFGATLGLPGGPEYQIGSYIDIGITKIQAGIGLEESLNFQINILRGLGYNLTEEEEKSYRNHVTNIYNELAIISDENCNDEEVCNN